MSKFASKFTSYSIDSSLFFIDVTAKHDDGSLIQGLPNERGPREIGTNAARTSNRTLDCKCAMHILSHITAPSENGMKEQMEKAQDEERQYTQACIKA